MHAARELSAKSSSRLGSSRSNFDPSWSPYLDELVGDLNEPLEITPPLTTSEMLAMLSDELVVPSMTPDNLASVIINNLAVRTDHIQNIDFFVRSRVEMASKGTLRFGERTLPRTYKKPSVDWHSPSPTRAVSMI